MQPSIYCICLLFIVYGFYPSRSTDYLHLSDYETEVKNAITNSDKYDHQMFDLPPQLLQPLFLSKMRAWAYKGFQKDGHGTIYDPTPKLFRSRASAKRDAAHFRGPVEPIPTQYDLSYHPNFKSLVIDFYCSADLKHDMAANLDKRYSSAQLFNFQGESEADTKTKNNIHVQTGVLSLLLDETFKRQMNTDLSTFSYRLVDIRQLIITGHSLGGAIAQCFFFLLHGDDDIVGLRYIHRLKGLLGLNQYNIYNADRTEITRPIINDDSNIFVITKGAFLIIPMEDVYPLALGLIRSNLIFNLIKRKDPVPMLFAGEIKPSKTKLSVEMDKHQGWKIGALKTGWDLGFLSTAKTIGSYFVIKKNKQQRTDLIKDGRPQNAVKIIKLMDLKYENKNDGNKVIDLPYFKKHLQEGGKRIGQQTFWHGNREGAQHLLSVVSVLLLPYAVLQRTKAAVSVAIRWGANHNEYNDDIERYIWTNSEYRNMEHMPEIAALFDKYPLPDASKKQQPMRLVVSHIGHEVNPTPLEMKQIRKTMEVFNPASLMGDHQHDHDFEEAVSSPKKVVHDLRHLLQQQIDILKTAQDHAPGFRLGSKIASLEQKQMAAKMAHSQYSNQYDELQEDVEISSMTPIIKANYDWQWILSLVSIGLLVALCVCWCYIITIIVSFVCGIIFANKYNDKLKLNHVLNDERV